MDDGHNQLPGPVHDGDRDDDCCDLDSHMGCHPTECEVHATLGLITKGQVIIAISGGVVTMLMSAIYGLAILALHSWAFMHSLPEPEVTWWQIGIMSFPFGGAAALAIRAKRPVKIEEV